jgi:hypothetical protein
MLIESSFGNPKPKKVQLLDGNFPLPLHFLGAKLFRACFLGQHSLSKKSDCGGWDFPLVPLFLSSHFL